MCHQDSLHKLIERIERATRGLDSYSYGPEHDQVRRYYTGLVVGGTSAPVAMERARCAVLFELLYQALPHAPKGLISYFSWREILSSIHAWRTPRRRIGLVHAKRSTSHGREGAYRVARTPRD